LAESQQLTRERNMATTFTPAEPVFLFDVDVDGIDWQVWATGRGEDRGFRWLEVEVDATGQQSLGLRLDAMTWTLDELRQAIREGR
jgi:hypothetical protein